MKKIFLRQSSHKKKKLEQKWRRPKGLQSKRRLNHAGHRKNISSGYRNDSSLRGKVNGLIPVIVKNLKDLDNLSKDNLIIISSTLGQRKKVELVNLCKTKSLKIHNVKDSDKYLESVKKIMSDKKEIRQKLKKEKVAKHTEKKEEKEKTTEKNPVEEKEKTTEEKPVKKEETSTKKSSDKKSEKNKD